MSASTHAGARSITSKLILVLLVVGLLPMLGTAYYTLQGGLGHIARQEQMNLQLLAETTANRLDQLIGNVEKVVRMLAADQEVIAFLDGDANARDRFRATTQQSLDSIVEVVPMFESVYLMDREGTFVAATNHKVVGKNFSFRNYFQNAIDGNIFVSDMIFGSTSGQAGVYFSGPVYDAKQQNIIGVAVVKLTAQAFTAILDSIGESHTTRPFLVDEDGVILHHPNPAVRFRTLKQLVQEQHDTILERKRYPVEQLISLDMAALYNTLQQHRGSGHTRFDAPLDSEPEVAGFAPMQRQPWTIVISEPETLFAEPLNRLFDQTLYSILLVATVILLIAAVWGRALTRPLQRIMQAAGAIEGGQYKDEKEPFDPARLELAPVTRRGDELGHLARVFESMAQQVYRREEELESLVALRTDELAQKHAQLEAAHHRIGEELKVAKALQLSILPTEFPQTGLYDLHAVMTPAREVGGDFYDFFMLNDQHVGIVVADVSGKGVPASFFMAVARTEMQNAAHELVSPGRVLQQVNDRLCRENPLELFVTVLYGILDLSNGEFVYASGGHNPPLHLRSNGDVSEMALTDGVALGVMEALDYDEARITLLPGDQVVFYTDGVTEAFSSSDEQFGEPRLMAAVTHAAAGSARITTDTVVAAVAEFSAGMEAFDDLTCLAVRFNGGSS